MSGPSSRDPGSGIAEVVMPLSGMKLQWRASDRAWRVWSAGRPGDGRWQRYTGSVELHIRADGEVWRRPSWLVGWGELPPGGDVEVLRTDDTAVEVQVVGRAWICEWVGHGEPVTVAYDHGFPRTLRIARPDSGG